MAGRLWLPAASVLAVVALLCAACGGGSGDGSAETSSGGPFTLLQPLSTLGTLEPAPAPGKLGGELVPIPNAPELAPAASEATTDKSVDGIKCEQNARLVFHVHSHVTVFVDGEQRTIPAGVGIYPPIGPQNYRGDQFGLTAENCITWLSTRYPDGLIHVESSEQRSFTLGDFFKVWGQPLGSDQVGPDKGDVTAIVNRKAWTGDPADIPLTPHAQIQLMVGKPLIAPQTIVFPGLF